ncbi:hypothetical protein [Actinophytocola sp. NPDC049390]|uniref:hypothetical protein n=1 Tax=Actinophytocola sp. NPDC049390 TaxID=3363894 RepID=UPI00379E00AC
MNCESIRELVSVHGPFVSVYLPSDVVEWNVLRHCLSVQDADPAVLAALDDALGRGTAAGRGLIATRDGVLVDMSPAWTPHAAVARVSDLPYLLPLVPRHAVRAPEASLVAAGRAREDAVSGSGDRTVFDQFMFESARPEGPVVQGVGRCAAALRAGNADALVIVEGALRDRAVWVGGTHRDQVAEEEADLRALGMPVDHQRADEALPMAALVVGADVLVAPEDLPLTDGVGVLLRHP